MDRDDWNYLAEVVKNAKCDDSVNGLVTEDEVTYHLSYKEGAGVCLHFPSCHTNLDIELKFASILCEVKTFQVWGTRKFGRGLLDALACAVVECGQVDDVTRRNAVLAILHLANHQKSKKMVAKQHNIVASLSRYGVSQDDDTELKSAALHGVIWLAPHM